MCCVFTLSHFKMSSNDFQLALKGKFFNHHFLRKDQCVTGGTENSHCTTLLMAIL
jgi:hypothetical protein